MCDDRLSPSEEYRQSVEGAREAFAKIDEQRNLSALPLLPHRARIDVTFPARDQEDAGRILEAITEAIEPWCFFELAACERMDDADVIPDSPLAEALG